MHLRNDIASQSIGILNVVNVGIPIWIVPMSTTRVYMLQQWFK